MVLKTIMSALQKFDVSPVLTVGEEFDPGKHEAIAYVETDPPSLNMVIEEHQKGYFYKDRLVRPALVSVSKPRACVEPATESQEANPVEKTHMDD